MIYNFEINVLVNGKKCKQYHHHGKTYIESKNESRYILEIKNNSSNRALVVSSVDGLSVLTGEPASESDSGYIIDSYSKVEIKGFRYSDERVGAFEFTKKTNNDSYASTKGSQKNVGVIGFRIFDEQNKRPLIMVNTITEIPYPWSIWPRTTITPLSPMYYTENTTNLDDGYLHDKITTSCVSPQNMSSNDNCLRSMNLSFKNDMATKWGDDIESKVISTEFNRGGLVYSLDIYYASRESLIKMGVPIIPNQKVSLPPNPFPQKYAIPPKNWKR